MAAPVTGLMDGFCVPVEKLLGPTQAYVAAWASETDALRFKVLPAHSGELLEPVTTGLACTLMVVVAVPIQPPSERMVRLTLCVPAAVGV